MTRLNILKKLQDFRSNENGSIIILSLVFLVLILVSGGMAIDFKRFESQRMQLQSVLDRSVVAAAHLDQQGAARDVVEDYLTKAGLASRIADLEVTTGNNSRLVTASARVKTDMIFLNMIGVGDMDVPVKASASAGAPNMEIALIVDVSQSMTGTRITKLREAAEDLVALLMPQSQSNQTYGRTIMSLVPYDMYVNMPPDLFAQFGVERLHDFSNCLMFGDNAFTSTALSSDMELEHAWHYETNSGYDANSSGWTGANEISWPECPRVAEDGEAGVNLMVPWSDDRSALLSAVENLTAGKGGTGIDTAFRIGVAMLDPSLRGAHAAMLGEAGGSMTAFPMDYDPQATEKVIILMTDGEIDGTRDIRDELKTKWSNVFYHETGQDYSVFLRGDWAVRYVDDNQNDNGSHKWYQVDRDDFNNYPDVPWRDADYYDDFDPPSDTSGLTGWYNNIYYEDGVLVEYQGLRRLTHAELFDHFTRGDFWTELFMPISFRGYLSWAEILMYASTRDDATNEAESTARLVNLCDLASEAGITVYTVAMDAPNDASRELMAACATNENLYFDVNNVDIAETFGSIANSINFSQVVLSE